MDGYRHAVVSLADLSRLFEGLKASGYCLVLQLPLAHRFVVVARCILEPLAPRRRRCDDRPAQMAFAYVAFMNEAFHSAPFDAAAWLRASAVALTASLIVGFEKPVRGQDEKNQAAGPNNRPMPQPSQR
jgi:hypothetical protein